MLERVDRSIQLSQEEKRVGEWARLRVFAVDTFHLFYTICPIIRASNSDHLLEKCREAMAEFQETDDYRRHRIRTKYDFDMSMLYATLFVKAVAGRIAEGLSEPTDSVAVSPRKDAGDGAETRGAGNDRKRVEMQGKGKEEAQLGEGGQGNLAPSGGYAQPCEKQGEGRLQEQTQEEDREQELDEVKSGITADELRAVMEEAGKKLERIGEVMEATGCSCGKGKVPFGNFLGEAIDLLSVEGLDEIVATCRELTMSLPRFEGTVRKKHAWKFGTEFSGYVQTASIEEAIASDLAVDDDLFYAKMSQGFTGLERSAVFEGNLYLLLDYSSSMDMREKKRWSRSVAVVLSNRAKQRGQKVFLRFFNQTPSKLCIGKGKNEELIYRLLTTKNDGNTEIQSAIETAVKDLEREGARQTVNLGTDTIVLISDGEDSVDPKLKDTLAEAEIKLITVMTGGENRTLGEISSQYLEASLDVAGGLRLISAVERA